jgi:hypothetical protein
MRGLKLILRYYQKSITIIFFKNYKAGDTPPAQHGAKNNSPLINPATG